MYSELNDKVVVITGASGGIGTGTAVEFARQGSRLVLVGRQSDKLIHTASLCKDVGLPEEKILLVLADITKESDIERIVQTTIDSFGTVHVLVNNAGISMIGGVSHISPADLDRVFDVNCRSVLALSQRLVSYLMENKGNIVNVSSTAAVRANPASIGYAMSKRCLDQMTKAMAMELGSQGVRVNGVNPSTVEDAPIYKNDGRCLDLSENKMTQHFQALRATVPLRRLCQVKDVAKAIVFLASDKSAFVTGLTLPIDGGFRNVTRRNPSLDLRNTEKT